jgi:hypothetical protein
MTREKDMISRRTATNEVTRIPLFISNTSWIYSLEKDIPSSLIFQEVFSPLMILAGKMPLDSGWEF